MRRKKNKSESESQASRAGRTIHSLLTWQRLFRLLHCHSGTTQSKTKGRQHFSEPLEVLSLSGASQTLEEHSKGSGSERRSSPCGGSLVTRLAPCLLRVSRLVCSAPQGDGRCQRGACLC